MTDIPKDLHVTMVLDDLDSAPIFNISRDYSIHWYEPGDEKHWTAIHLVADLYNRITPDTFWEQFGDKDLDLSERQVYVLDREGRFVATATAWEKRGGRYDGWGRVHWVAVLPEFQNRGLGKMLMSIVCERLREMGYRSAFLDTSTMRPNAIHLYETFGFRVADIREWGEGG